GGGGGEEEGRRARKRRHEAEAVGTPVVTYAPGTSPAFLFVLQGAMQFDLDAAVDRTGTWGSRWEKYAGRDVIPLWGADGAFRVLQVRTGIFACCSPCSTRCAGASSTACSATAPPPTSCANSSRLACWIATAGGSTRGGSCFLRGAGPASLWRPGHL